MSSECQKYPGINGPNNLHPYAPFDAQRFLSGTLMPEADDYPVHTYLTGLGIRSLIQQRGLQPAYKLLNKRGGHAAELMRKHADFLPANTPDLQPPDLNGLYRRSLRLGNWPAEAENGYAMTANVVLASHNPELCDCHHA